MPGLNTHLEIEVMKVGGRLEGNVLFQGTENHLLLGASLEPSASHYNISHPVGGQPTIHINNIRGVDIFLSVKLISGERWGNFSN